MLHKLRCLALFLLFALQLSAQDAKFAGTYYNYSGEPELTLNEDGTFKSITTAYSFDGPKLKNSKQEHEGIWISDGDEITLNPDRKPRETMVELVESSTNDSDSITVVIDYFQQSFENEVPTSINKFNFPLLEFFINKTSKNYTLIKNKNFESMLFYPPKNKIYLDSTNTFKIPKTAITKIGIDLMGMNKIVWIPVSDKKHNHLLITAIHQVDLDSRYRSTKLIIKGNKAYQSIKNGKIDSSAKEYPLVRK